MLEQINNEYSIFASKKEHLISNLREHTKKTIELLSDLELPSLCNYLSTKYANTKLNNFICDFCNDFIGKNRSSISSHKKFCQKNPDIINKNKESIQKTITETIIEPIKEPIKEPITETITETIKEPIKEKKKIIKKNNKKK